MITFCIKEKLIEKLKIHFPLLIISLLPCAIFQYSD